MTNTEIRELRTKRALWLPIVVTLVLVVVGDVAALLVADRLGGRVATHWGADGRPDGFSTPTQALVFGSVFPLFMGGFLLGIGILAKQRAQLGALVAGLSAFMVALFHGATILQGWTSGPAVVNVAMVIGLVAAGVLGLGTYQFLKLPPSDVVASGPLPAGAEVLDRVPDGARLAWSGRTRVATPGLVVMGVAFVPLLVMVGVGLFLQQWGMVLLMTVMVVVIAVLATSMFSTVTVDARGVRARGVGFNWIDVPLSTIVGATVLPHVEPVGEFGGWGLRTGLDGRRGLVTMAGPALRLQRVDEPDVVITLADSEAAAKTVNTLVQRSR